MKRISVLKTSALWIVLVLVGAHGVARAGAAYQGTAYQGAAYQGAAYQGAAYQGAAYQGAAYQGAAYQGAAYQGAAYQGAAYQGAAYQGAAYQGAAYQGAAYQGAAYQGAAYQGAAYQGAALRDGWLEGARLFGTIVLPVTNAALDPTLTYGYTRGPGSESVSQCIARSPRLLPGCIPRLPGCIPRHYSTSSTTSRMHPRHRSLYSNTYPDPPKAYLDARVAFLMTAALYSDEGW